MCVEPSTYASNYWYPSQITRFFIDKLHNGETRYHTEAEALTGFIFYNKDGILSTKGFTITWKLEAAADHILKVNISIRRNNENYLNSPI
jgi:hypothetical protein